MGMIERSNGVRWRAGILAAVLFCILLSCGPARALDARFEDLVAIETSAAKDSVRVGERLPIRFNLRYPDSLTLCPVAALPEGAFLPLSVEWKERGTDRKSTVTEGRIVISTLDLEAAVLPPIRLQFKTASGDTLSGYTPEVRVPVRRTVNAESELKPLKRQWMAPRSWLAPILMALALALAAAALLFWRRRRKTRAAVEPLRPALPPEVTAYRDLIRIEKSKILENGEFKEYYTRVIDVLRRYIEGRFSVEAMDRTTDELVASLREERIVIAGLEEMLRESDLVKFAKLSPGLAPGKRLMESTRRCIAETTPQSAEETPVRESAEG
jgi:hypothetical protein